MKTYKYDMANDFTTYTHDESKKKETNYRMRSMRLELISLVAKLLSKAMGLLGIELPERM